MACATMVLVYGLNGFWLLHTLEPGRLSRNLATEINKQTQPGEPVYICDYAEPSTFFYLKNRGRFLQHWELPDLLAADHPASFTLAATTSAFDELEPRLRSRIITTGQVRGFNYVKMQSTSLQIGKFMRSPPATAP